MQIRIKEIRAFIDETIKHRNQTIKKFEYKKIKKEVKKFSGPLNQISYLERIKKQIKLTIIKDVDLVEAKISDTKKNISRLDNKASNELRQSLGNIYNIKEIGKNFVSELDIIIKKLDEDIDQIKKVNAIKIRSRKNTPTIEVKDERLIWNSTKQDLVAFYDKLMELNLIFRSTGKDKLLNKHFVILTGNEAVSEVGELKHTRKQLNDVAAKPTEKMQIVLDAIGKGFSVDKK